MDFLTPPPPPTPAVIFSLGLKDSAHTFLMDILAEFSFSYYRSQIHKFTEK